MCVSVKEIVISIFLLKKPKITFNCLILKYHTINNYLILKYHIQDTRNSPC